MNLISLLTYNFNSQFFITTHSPYLLSILNNFIYANELIENKKITLQDFHQISSDGYPLKFDDIYAFSIKDGCSVSIMDDDYKLVDTNFLDTASNTAENIFNKLLESSS